MSDKTMRRLGIVFILTVIVAMLVWVNFWISGKQSELFDGLSIEIIGAIFTAGAVIWLERALSGDDPQIEALQKQIQQQQATIEALHRDVLELIGKRDDNGHDNGSDDAT